VEHRGAVLHRKYPLQLQSTHNQGRQLLNTTLWVALCPALRIESLFPSACHTSRIKKVGDRKGIQPFKNLLYHPTECKFIWRYRLTGYDHLNDDDDDDDDDDESFIVITVGVIVWTRLDDIEQLFNKYYEIRYCIHYIVVCITWSLHVRYMLRCEKRIVSRQARDARTQTHANLGE
jgi:hypothetical protein